MLGRGRSQLDGTGKAGLRDDVGANPAHPTICGRCDSNLHGDGEHRTVA